MGGGIGSSVCWFQNALYRRGIPPTAAAATNTATIAAAIAAHCYFLTAIFCNIHEYILSIHGTWSTSRDPMFGLSIAPSTLTYEYILSMSMILC